MASNSFSYNGTDIADDDVDQRNLYFDENASFSAVFGDAYTFKNLIEYLYATNEDGTFIFSKDEIRYNQKDSDNTTLNDISIDVSNLIEYRYDSIYPELPIRLEIELLRSNIKGIQRKGQLRLYKVPRDNTLYVFVGPDASANNEMTNVGHIQPKVITEIEDYLMNDYSRSESNPNCTIMLSRFSEACKSLTHIKSPEISITGYNNGITIQGKMPGRTNGKMHMFGSITEDEFLEGNSDANTPLRQINMGDKLDNCPVLNVIDDDFSPISSSLSRKDGSSRIPQINIPVKTIRALNKIETLTTNGIVKIYIEKNLPMKLLAYIGNYGIIRVYVNGIN